MNTVEQLKAEVNALVTQLRSSNNEAIVKKIHAKEAELKAARTAERLDQVNSKYNRIRDYARQAWEAEIPTEDPTTNDGSLHKTKAKKYPKLAALEYVRGTWKDGHLTELRVNGERFVMYHTEYEYTQPLKYTRPATFEEFLKLNSVPVKPITSEQYAEFSAKLTAANERLKAAIAEYDKERKELEVSSWNYWGLAEQSNTNTYIYEVR